MANAFQQEQLRNFLAESLRQQQEQIQAASRRSVQPKAEATLSGEELRILTAVHGQTHQRDEKLATRPEGPDAGYAVVKLQSRADAWESIQLGFLPVADELEELTHEKDKIMIILSIEEPTGPCIVGYGVLRPPVLDNDAARKQIEQRARAGSIPAPDDSDVMPKCCNQVALPKASLWPRVARVGFVKMGTVPMEGSVTEVLPVDRGSNLCDMVDESAQAVLKEAAARRTIRTRVSKTGIDVAGLSRESYILVVLNKRREQLAQAAELRASEVQPHVAPAEAAASRPSPVKRKLSDAAPQQQPDEKAADAGSEVLAQLMNLSRPPPEKAMRTFAPAKQQQQQQQQQTYRPSTLPYSFHQHPQQQQQHQQSVATENQLLTQLLSLPPAGQQQQQQRQAQNGNDLLSTLQRQLR
ncbi:hypothetical protein DIPPA_20769 [Diplonema papillatum]|nr:hypothetical protein DIPPA_20769 [Diplonema papillatum]